MKMTIRMFAIALLFGTLAFTAGCSDRSPKAVCEHFIEVSGADEEEVEECTEDVKKMKEEMGEENYNKFADCVLEADSKEAAEECR